MLQKWICVGGLLFVFMPTVWSDEAPAPQGVKKQRVSPKLLREAMNLPEYKGQPATTTPPPNLEHLQRLSEKLKTNGDTEGCELLQRFMHEHQRMANQSARISEKEAAFTVRCQVVDVHFDKLSKDSILHNGLPDSQHIDAFCKELDRAVTAKHATRLFEPVTLSTRTNEIGHFHQGEEISIPSSDGSSPHKYWKTGTIIELFVTPIEHDKNRLEMTIELIDPKSTAIGNDFEPLADPLHHRKMEATIETLIGETSVHVIPSDLPGHKIFFVTRIMPKK
jgi:hypothetical protein